MSTKSEAEASVALDGETQVVDGPVTVGEAGGTGGGMRRALVRALFKIGWFFDSVAVRLDRTLYAHLWLEARAKWNERQYHAHPHGEGE
jgi:hypothetical protein